MPRNLQPQREQIKPTDAYYGDYSALAEQFLKNRGGRKPVHSIGQGIAEVLGDVGEAYFLRKAREKEQKKEQKDLSDMAMAQQFAIDPGLAKDPRSGALYSAQDFGGVGYQGPTATAEPGTRRLAQSVSFDAQSVNPMSAQQRGAAAYGRLAETNPRAAGASDPASYAQLAQQFEPPVKWQDVPQPGGGVAQRNPQTNQMVNVVPGRDPQAPEPLVEVADPNDPTRGVMVPRSQAAGRATVQTVRDRMPRVKTYYDEEGNPLTLDANDPVDQATIKERSLVESAPTEAERVSKGFLDRMVAAEPNMQAVVDQGYDPSNFRDKNVRDLPFGNYGVSDQGQLYRQAQEDWVRAKLRKESGAVIGDDEMEREIKTYFPQPGDTPAVQAQKAVSRKGAERQLATTAGLLGRKYLRGDVEKKASAPNEEGIPDGVDANVWKFMTPEERALWSK